MVQNLSIVWYTIFIYVFVQNPTPFTQKRTNNDGLRDANDINYFSVFGTTFNTAAILQGATQHR